MKTFPEEMFLVGFCPMSGVERKIWVYVEDFGINFDVFFIVLRLFHNNCDEINKSIERIDEII